ncbi:MAG: hypothetical protein RMJ56_06135 [Gemmataceae bacterium]|nr:hypothetical protein [Gemmataceae bacterium]
MADGRDQSSGFNYRTFLPWTQIFRCFQIALDPRKLFVAALGIFVMSFLWWVLSNIFYYKPPKIDDPDYQTSTIQRDFEGKLNPATGKNYTNEELEVAVAAEARRRFDRDYAQWQELDRLAGPGGRLRTMPWYEYRGPNPFIFFTDVLSGTAEERGQAIYGFLTGSVPVLIEPLVKLLLPVAKIVSPDISTLTRIYLFLILLANVAVWAFSGGIITRIAAIQLANKGPITLMQAVRFVVKRYANYLGAPLIPLAIIAAVVLGLIFYGLLALVPLLGDIFLFGLGLPVILIGGAMMTVFLIGLVGYPMMYPTLSVEGDQSDTFDALSRSVNYVYQAPWHYIWNWLVAVLYGAVVTLFVLFFASLTVYVGKWAVGLTASAVWSDRKPDFLFIYAPESFGWKELLTKDSPYAVSSSWEPVKESNRLVMTYKPVNAAVYETAKAELWWYNLWGAGIVTFWLTLAFLLMLGFSYSFFWSAATMIYYLMRKKVDEAELDEVFEDEEPEIPPVPPLPKGASEPTTSASSPTSLPVIAPPATIPFNPPASASPPAPPAPSAPAVPPVSPPPAEPPAPSATVVPPSPPAEPPAPSATVVPPSPPAEPPAPSATVVPPVPPPAEPPSPPAEPPVAPEPPAAPVVVSPPSEPPPSATPPMTEGEVSQGREPPPTEGESPLR